MQVEGEIGSENAVTKQAEFPGLDDGFFHAADGQPVLSPDVDKAFICTDCIGGNHHGFDDGVGIALQDQSVFEGARLAFIGVADHIFFLPFSARNKLPF